MFGHTSRSPRALRVLACAFAVCALSASGAAAPAAAPRARSGPPPLVRYVALGDSEAAAPGVPRQVDARCERSSNDYPSVVAARLRPASFTDVTCTGARTTDLARGQFPALRLDTTLVTLTIGANDFGFADIAVKCSALGLFDAAGAPCRHLYGSRLAGRIAATAPKVSAALRTVHRLAPNARVLLVGYLNLIPDDHRGCRPRELFAAGDLPWLDAAENSLDATLARTARSAGAAFVDQRRISAAHDICRPDGVRWTEAIRPTRPAIPFHPNQLGEAAMAGQVLTVLASR
ncbi:SGNH/GDSL hydrolase family protein [Streptomyces sp. SL13]|uniref:SGNH/GDSL hydrolase family protein n=1 Tax=Streptantibioticus silvisoli TaxID=2705255 RepID=A0AA90H4H2_9ACTN|nr:SGNH/GDSL hydrolase family protein [Streptantibioticus silvisoli]MDI5970630.1 SGNH/GDSL hydrolase family protein [Streptantibioticus silvisoli]